MAKNPTPNPSDERKDFFSLGDLESSSNPQRLSIMPTLYPAQNFNSDNDAIQILASFAGIGCDKKKLINILGHRSSLQRDQIYMSYQKLFKRDLVACAKYELTFAIEKAVVATIYTGPTAYAYLLKHSMVGAGTNDSILCGLVVSCSFEQLQQIKVSYSKISRNTLEKDIRSDTSGLYREYLLKLITVTRTTETIETKSLATTTAMLIVSKNSTLEYTDEKTLLDIFTTQSHSQLKLLFLTYPEVARKSILKLIKKISSRDVKRLIKFIYYFVSDPNVFVCRMLRNGIKKRDLSQIVAFVITRCEIDLQSAIDVYNNNFGSFIIDLVSNFESSNAEVVLLLKALMGHA